MQSGEDGPVVIATLYITMCTHTLSSNRLTSGWWWRSCSRWVREVSSLHSLSQSSDIDYGAPESIHNDPPGRSGLGSPQEGDDNVEEAIARVQVPHVNGLYFVCFQLQLH